MHALSNKLTYFELFIRAMNELLNQFAEAGGAFSTANYIVNILICFVLLYILSLIYVKYGSSISNRQQLSRVLILVGLTTFIIISIVKSSLALSLGLVGALSIIRFRTAIKEPEELSYFFISIALGLGLGANQIYPTVIGYVIVCLVVVFLNYRKLKHISQHLLITLEVAEDQKDNVVDQLSEILSTNSNQLELKRLKYKAGILNANFFINVKSLQDINRINNSLQVKFGANTDITFIDNQI